MLYAHHKPLQESLRVKIVIEPAKLLTERTNRSANDRLKLNYFTMPAKCKSFYFGILFSIGHFHAFERFNRYLLAAQEDLHCLQIWGLITADFADHGQDQYRPTLDNIVIYTHHHDDH